MYTPFLYYFILNCDIMSNLKYSIIYRGLLLTAGLFFLIWYIPVAYVNVYACDDYWFGANVSNYGFWGTQLYYWINWEGSFTHTFLDSLPHVFNHERMPFVVNIFSLCFFIFALYYAFITIFKNNKLNAILHSLYTTAILYTFTNGGSEIRFWVSANSYIVELALVMIALSLYHQKDDTKKTIKWYLCIFILLFFIAGSKLTFILYTFASIIIHDIMLEKKPNQKTYIVIGALILFSLLNILAPGNLIRLDVETTPAIHDSYSIWDTLSIRGKQIIPFLGYSLLMIPIAMNTKLLFNLTIRRAIFIILGIIIVFSIDGVIMYICFHDPGPMRVYVIFELFILFFVIILFSGLDIIHDLNKYIVNSIYTLSTIVLLFTNISLIMDVKPTIEFARKSRERNSLVMNYSPSKPLEIIELEPLPDSHLLLSYFSNEQGWLEYVYMPYFNKSCKVVIKDMVNE